MPKDLLPPCRHRGPQLAQTVYPCHSPKLVGLPLVTAAVCHACYCCDHELDPASPERPRLRACAYLGQPQLDGGEVHACSHPAHGQTTLLHCRACPDYLFPLLTPLTPATEVYRLLQLPPRLQAFDWWTWPRVQEAFDEMTRNFLGGLEPYPQSRYHGRGVVLVGGGKYFPSVYVTVRALRHTGCTLPIRLYYFGADGEMPLRWQDVLAPYAVHCINLNDATTDFAFPQGFEPASTTERGWIAKVRAILDSPFEEVLFLDADSYPCRNPEFLFELPAYRETGAIFWHDGEHDPRLNWRAFGLTTVPDASVESGQLVVHKGACWAPLRLGWWYAAHSATTFHWGYGDKHVCFQVPWAKLGRPYLSFATTPDWSVHAFRHIGPDGAPLFLHRCRDKFRFPGASDWLSAQNFESNLFNPDLPLEAEAFAWMAELARTLGVHRGVLNLGCGRRPLFGAHNHDRRRHAPFVDTAHDLDRHPWPWPDASFERVVAEDVLEYLDDVVGFMEEAHRVLKPGGLLRLRVPHYQSENAAIDPTHRRGFHPRSLEFFTRGGYGMHSVYAERRWRIVTQGQEEIPGGPNLLWELAPLSFTGRSS